MPRVATPVAGAALASCLLVLLVAVPLGGLVWVTATAGAGTISDTLTGPAGTDALLGTLLVGVGSCVLAVPAGTALALVTERANVPGRSALRVAMLVPLLIPDYVLAVSMSLVYGPAGYSDDLLGVALPGLLGAVGVVLVVAVTAVPLVYLVVAAALAVQAEPDLERAARAAGASAATTFRTVTLPLLRMPLTAALALTFVTAVNSFAVPQVLGVPAGFSTVTTRIYTSLTLSASPDAFASLVVLALALVVLVILAVGSVDLAAGSLRPTVRTSLPTGGAVTGPVRPGGVALAAAVWAGVALTLVVPLAGIVLTALTPAVGVAPVPSNWSLENLRTALAGEAVSGLANSAVLGVCAASILLGLGALVVALDRRRGGWLGTLVTLTFAIPGSALAVGVLLAYGRWITGSLLIVLIAYLAKLWALAHRSIAAAADRLPPDLVRAAHTSGASPAAALRTVVGPMLAPALAGAWALVFVMALHEVTMSSLLYGPDSVTLAVAVLNLQQLGDVGATAALSVVVTLVPVLAVLPLTGYRRWARHRRLTTS